MPNRSSTRQASMCCGPYPSAPNEKSHQRDWGASPAWHRDVQSAGKPHPTKSVHTGSQCGWVSGTGPGSRAPPIFLLRGRLQAPSWLWAPATLRSFGDIIHTPDATPPAFSVRPLGICWASRTPCTVRTQVHMQVQSHLPLLPFSPPDFHPCPRFQLEITKTGCCPWQALVPPRSPQQGHQRLSHKGKAWLSQQSLA